MFREAALIKRLSMKINNNAFNTYIRTTNMLSSHQPIASTIGPLQSVNRIEIVITVYAYVWFCGVNFYAIIVAAVSGNLFCEFFPLYTHSRYSFEVAYAAICKLAKPLSKGQFKFRYIFFFFSIYKFYLAAAIKFA